MPQLGAPSPVASNPEDSTYESAAGKLLSSPPPPPSPNCHFLTPKKLSGCALTYLLIWLLRVSGGEICLEVLVKMFNVSLSLWMFMTVWFFLFWSASNTEDEAKSATSDPKNMTDLLWFIPGLKTLQLIPSITLWRARTSTAGVDFTTHSCSPVDHRHPRGGSAGLRDGWGAKCLIPNLAFHVFISLFCTFSAPVVMVSSPYPPVGLHLLCPTCVQLFLVLLFVYSCFVCFSLSSSISPHVD